MAMTDDEKTIRTRAKELLESGEVKFFVGWEAGRFENQTTPLITSDPAKCEKLVWNEYCVNTLSKYAKDLVPEGKVGMVVRGCDSRGIVRMILDKVFTREDVYLLGVGCPGIKDRKTGEQLDKCVNCRHHDAVIFDEMIGAESGATCEVERFHQVVDVENMSRQERESFFADMYAKCIRCYACRDVCPCCTCRECFVDQRREAWVGKQNNIPENRFYGLTRVMHIGDRCVECGECERACPMDLPLMALNRKVIQDMNSLFGEYEAGLTLDGDPDTLVTYNLDDLEEFM